MITVQRLIRQLNLRPMTWQLNEALRVSELIDDAKAPSACLNLNSLPMRWTHCSSFLVLTLWLSMTVMLGMALFSITVVLMNSGSLMCSLWRCPAKVAFMTLRGANSPGSSDYWMPILSAWQTARTGLALRLDHAIARICSWHPEVKSGSLNSSHAQAGGELKDGSHQENHQETDEERHVRDAHAAKAEE